MKCPNKNSKEWKDLVAKYGEATAYAKYNISPTALNNLDGKSKIDLLVSELKGNSSFIRLSEDGSHYINSKRPGLVYKRVTSIVNKGSFPEQMLEDETFEEFNKRLDILGLNTAEKYQANLLASSQIIGNKVDELVRSVFDGESIDIKSIDVSKQDIVLNFIKQLNSLKSELTSRGEKFLANDIILYNDELAIAGTVDLLTYDDNGNIRIYDIKTMRGDKFKNTKYGIKYDSKAVFEKPTKMKDDGTPEYKVIKGVEGESDREKHNKQLSLYNILLNNTHGISAKSLHIIPIEVAYNPKEYATKTLKLHPIVDHSINPNVEGAQLKSENTKSIDEISNIPTKTNNENKLEEEEYEVIRADADFVDGIDSSVQTMAVNSLYNRFIKGALVNKTSVNKHVEEYKKGILSRIKKTNEFLESAEKKLKDSTTSEDKKVIISKQMVISSAKVTALEMLYDDANSPNSKVVKHAINKLKTLKEFTLTDKTGAIKDLELSTEGSAELDRNSWNDDFWISIDSKKTTSVELRLFLANLSKKHLVRDKQNNLVVEEKRDMLGQTIKIDFNAAYDELHRLLVGQDEDLNQLLKILEDHSGGDIALEDKYWMRDLISKIKEQPLQVQAGFVSDMTRHYLDMKVLSIQEVDAKDGNGTLLGYKGYELVTKSAHLSAMSTATMMKWIANLQSKEFLVYNMEKDDYIYEISDGTFNRIRDRYDKLRNNPKNALLLQEFFDEFGITLENKAANELVYRDFLYLPSGKRITYNHLINEQAKYLVDELKTIKFDSVNKEVTYTSNTLIGQSSIGYTSKSMALINAKYTPDLFVNSYRVGNKPINAYAMNHYASARAKDLKKEDRKLVRSLLDTVFSRHSYYAKQLNDATSDFIDIFDLNTTSIIPIANNNNKKLSELTPGEHLLVKNGYYFSVGPEQTKKTTNSKGETFTTRKSTFLYPSSSNKASILNTTAPAFQLEYNKDGSLDNKFLDLMIDNVIMSEWDRIYNTRNHGKKSNQLFYLFPELNNLTIDLENEDGTTTEKSLISIAMSNSNINSQVRDILRSKVNDRINKLTTQQLKYWEKTGIGEHVKNSKGKDIKRFSYLPYNHVHDTSLRIGKMVDGETMKNTGGTRYYMSQEMTYNYMFNHANMFQLFIGDIQSYAEQDNAIIEANNMSDDDIYKSAIDNLGKRMAAEIAPGYSMASHVYQKLFGNTQYIQLYANSIETSLGKSYIEYAKKVLKDVAPGKEKEYDAIDSTDAQEFTTWREHLTIMLASDRINESRYNDLVSKLSAGEELKGSDLKIVLNPMKPIMAGSKFYTIGDTQFSKRTYIKSSSFPLLPQLTKNNELDDLRKKMEELEKPSKENGNMMRPVRFAYDSGVKVGGVNLKKNIYDENGKLNELVLHDIDANPITINNEANIAYEILDRKDFRIQQDVPYKENKSTINVGAQSSKLTFADILDLNGYYLDDEEGPISGRDLKKIYDRVNKTIFYKKYSKFTNRFLDDGVVNNQKISDILLEELNRLDIPTTPEIQGLKVVDNEFVTPLWMSPHSERYSQVLNSVLYNNLIKRDHKGGSHVLGTSTGLKSFEDADKTGIIYTESFNGDKLLPMRYDEKTKKMLPAQVVVPFKFFDKNGEKLVDENGNELFVRDFITEKDGKQIIDINKLPKEVLEGFGFRIPTQSKASMTYFEIVGFLPDNMGDLMLASEQFVAQMGSDFDLDKLYSYLYHIEYDNKTNTISKLKSEEVTDAGLENKLLDLHLSVIKNPSIDVQSKIINPLLYGNLNEYRDTLNNLKKEDDLPPTYLSHIFNMERYLDGQSGKNAISFFASASVLNAVLQDNTHIMQEVIEGEEKPLSMVISFGNKYNKSYGNLSEPITLKIGGKQFKSEQFSTFLSASVDDEIQKILSAINVNDETFKVVAFLLQLGFDSDVIIPFINQPIIKQYTEQLAKSKSFTSGYIENLKDETANNLYSRYSKHYDEKLADFEGEDAETIMMNMLKNSNYPDFNQYQSALLNKFIKLNEKAEHYNELLKLGNVDSKGMGKSMAEAQFKKTKIEATLLSNSKFPISNLNKLSETSVSSFAFDNYSKGMDLVKDLFIETRSDIPFAHMINEYLDIIGKKSIDDLKLEEYTGLIKAVKYYVYGLHSEKRESLLKGQNSVLKDLQKIQDSRYFKSNQFFNKLDVTNTAYKNKYDGVLFSMNKGNEFTNSLIYQGFVDALNYNKEINGVNVRNLTEKLVDYSMLDGARFSAIAFSKFLPSIYNEKLGINDYGKNINLDHHWPFILEQYIQHNPHLVPTIGGVVTNGGNNFSVAKQELRRPKYIKSGYSNDLKLFKLHTDNHYYRIDILGDGNKLNEYSYPSNNPAISVVRGNGKGTESPMHPLLTSNVLNKEDLADKINLTEAEKTKLNAPTRPLLTLSNRSGYDVLSELNDPLASALASSFKFVLDKVNIKIDPNLKVLGNAEGLNVKISLEAWESLTTKDLSKLVIHEVIHTLTSQVLGSTLNYSDEQLEILSKITAKRFSVIANLTVNEVDEFAEVLKKLAKHYEIKSGDHDKAKSNMKYLFMGMEGMHPKLDETINEILTSIDTMPDYDIDKLNSISKRGQWANYYALINDDEFLASVGADENVQIFIDSKIKATGGLQAIKNIILEFLNLFGLSGKASGEVIELMFSTADIYQSILKDSTSKITEDLTQQQKEQRIPLDYMDENPVMKNGEVVSLNKITSRDYLSNLTNEQQEYLLKLAGKNLIKIMC